MIDKKIGLSILLIIVTVFNFGISSMAETKSEVAILAGGCFWCLEAPFDDNRGVLETHVGYTGGERNTANYKAVSRGDSGHYEAIKIVFDPSITSYREILQIFWRQIDPTQANGQFADIGPQYRSAIFYINEDQRLEAEQSKLELTKSAKFSKPIVTEIKKAQEFYLAEEDHQDYYKKAPVHYQQYKYGSGRAGFIEKSWGK